ncbi:MAG TPA: hypothetical protein VJB37_00525 [Patescibacteria group bacterium]|nr:hypothetical protein [Patescibacteria group bacterium]
MRRFKLSAVILVIFSSILLANQVLALDIGFSKVEKAAKTAEYDSGTNEQSLARTVGVAVKAGLSMLGVIFLGLMVYAGYLWMTARGEENDIEKSQKIVITAVVGLVIVVSAYGITDFVVPRILSRTASTEGTTETGDLGVDCCKKCESAWSVTCDRYQWDKKQCIDEGGEYLGKIDPKECVEPKAEE